MALILSLMMLFQLKYLCEVQLDGIEMMAVVTHKVKKRRSGTGFSKYHSKIRLEEIRGN